MPELHSTILVRHPDARIHRRLGLLLQSMHDSTAALAGVAESLNPAAGRVLVDDLLGEVREVCREDLSPEPLSSRHGHWVVGLDHGPNGDCTVRHVLRFLCELCPEVHAQAWGYADDRAWEYWFKVDGGQLLRCDDQPRLNRADAYVVSTIYRWWHAGLPPDMRFGLIDPDAVYREAAWDEEGDGQDCREPLTDDEFVQWVAILRSGGGVCEEPVAADAEALAEVRELVSSLTAVPGGQPAQPGAGIDRVTEAGVLRAFESLGQAAQRLDPEAVLAYFSRNLSGRTQVGEESTPLTYGLLSLSLHALLTPESRYSIEQTVRSFDLNEDGSGTLVAESLTRFIEPVSEMTMEVHSEDRYLWDLEDGRLQITEVQTRQID